MLTPWSRSSEATGTEDEGGWLYLYIHTNIISLDKIHLHFLKSLSSMRKMHSELLRSFSQEFKRPMVTDWSVWWTDRHCRIGPMPRTPARIWRLKATSSMPEPTLSGEQGMTHPVVVVEARGQF